MTKTLALVPSLIAAVCVFLATSLLLGLCGVSAHVAVLLPLGLAIVAALLLHSKIRP